eukprot:CAMPEP_0114336516 /NCGR_PEP_ID=MMETSP0101-20121206/5762_1 /TAXON_ID=38822 ORGANISM="Pteridomonas danica, Strain PT" /NCGR_SAMPLE_ID=MMETSP0101 /ASSEMBLY_ACC=CAM_ASM_000211 /LENGTH=193 /DNA_ID=CAMNT_0001468471 /DNA_START=138 /DNA_END=719 /DNA_ORIENTATION=-
MSSEHWLESYEKTANQIAEINDSHVRPAIVAAVKKLDQQLQEMEANPSKYVLDYKELARRRELLKVLQDKIKPVFGGGTFIRPPSDAGSPTNGVQLGAFQQRQMMAEQDLLVDEIGLGVDRLHERAVNIKDESKLHTSLLSDMDVDVEKAMSGLERETRNATEVRKKTSNCSLYGCIILLLVVLVFLLILGFQ